MTKMMALISPHMSRPNWARRKEKASATDDSGGGGEEELGLLGAGDREASIETISLAVAGSGAGVPEAAKVQGHKPPPQQLRREKVGAVRLKL